MPSIIAPSVLLYRNPTFKPALAALVEHLMKKDYSSHAIGKIFNFVAVHGTLYGSIIEPEDEEEAESIFVANLPEVPDSSDSWDRDQSVIFDVELLSNGNHPWPLVQDVDDDRREPTDDDWKDYRRHFDSDEAPMWGYE